ncbi:Nucleoside diphosphate-linked moiety X motif 19, mitochondrial [Smittium mucronatum]|uniref:Nucleoside diphosphate-linked moiety X motif 19, mitochondrial n=1 Tax=Smittium mucronatum TaxID=133383 RepID=A0A1R0GQ97_9FUNG|nr:Nucleoside diphosphate-linked moiety X motif 19, mitochondrial [Smittium mucronatum]
MPLPNSLSYFVSRVESGSFPSFHVFPGGKIEYSDGLPEWLNLVDVGDNIQPNSLQLSSKKTEDLSILDFKICAIRESYEETGFLLASKIPNIHDSIKSQHQKEFINFVKDNDIKVLSSRLLYFCRWITPKQSFRRWDVQFFMLNISDSQEDSNLLVQIYPQLNPSSNTNMMHQVSELVCLDWRTPDKFYDAFCEGEIKTVTPQVYMLNQMKMFHRWQDLQNFAIYKDTVEGIKPFISYLNLKPYPAVKIYTLPGDHMYQTQFEDKIDLEQEGDFSKPIHRVIVKKFCKGKKKNVRIVENIVNIPGIKFPTVPLPNKL